MKRNISEHPFFVWMGKIGDVVLLSLCWLICSLPVITIGASTTALLSVAEKFAGGQEYTAIGDFCASFRENFKQATRYWLPMVIAAVLLVMDFRIGSNAVAQQSNSIFGMVLLGASGCFCLVWLMLFGWGAALLARFRYDSAKGLATDALRMAVGNPLQSLLMVLLIVWMPLCLIYAVEVFVYLAPLCLLFAAGGSALATAYAVKPALMKIEKSKMR